MWNTGLISRLLAILLLGALPAAAQCLVMGPSATGNGSGSDWNNQKLLTGSGLTRGTTYYVADGDYTGLGDIFWSTAPSGTTLITITKATVSDHCTETGWSDTLGDGQAQFADWSWGSPYWVLDGNGTSAGPGCGAANGAPTSDCGFWVGTPGSQTTRSLSFDENANAGIGNITIKYVEGVGFGLDQEPTGCENFIDLRGNPQNITFQHIYLRNGGTGTHAKLAGFGDPTGPQNITFEYSYFAGQSSSGNCHGQAIEMAESSAITIRYNVFKDIVGTGTIVGLQDTTSSPNTKVYGNVFIGGTRTVNTDGIVVCINSGKTCNGWEVYNNSAYNMNGKDGFGGNPNFVKTESLLSACSFTVRNNLSYQGVVGILDQEGCVTASNNTNVGSDPFVNASGGDFHLSAATAAGTTLSSPYDVDPDGVTRGADGNWDLGAYEYVAGGGGGGNNRRVGVIPTQ